MKLISFENKGVPGWGLIQAGDALEPADNMAVVELGSRLGAPTLRDALNDSKLGLASEFSNEKNTLRFGDLTLRRPIVAPEKIVCVGVNYADRNEEYKDDKSAAKYPSLFIRFQDSLVASGELLRRPPESEQLDYEGEIVVVIGKAGRRIPQDKAAEHIAGLSVMNEGTIRDWLRHGKFNVTQGKNFVASGAFGPWLVTLDECPELTDMSITTWVNNEVRQQDNTRRMAFPLSHLVSYISTFMMLKPGDVIATGTPTGAGARFDPPKWLVPDDEVIVTVDGVGTLRNRVADE
ncbi:MAG: fumarylacetoacetate hydrolase family protein [Burkholderiaceae bacterium]